MCLVVFAAACTTTRTQRASIAAAECVFALDTTLLAQFSFFDLFLCVLGNVRETVEGNMKRGVFDASVFQMAEQEIVSLMVCILFSSMSRANEHTTARECFVVVIGL